jgi:D-amino-acid oxidase
VTPFPFVLSLSKGVGDTVHQTPFDFAQDERMLLDRRAFTAGGFAALLAACATTPRRTTAEPCTPLPPVKVDASRVIRATAGLRPYRASGFVVRREQIGDKALVHNYGHGGAGITLSWGSSRLATNLGLPGHSGPVAVIGAGIMGQTTARLVQQAGFPVTIYAAALPPDTTSNVAAGQISPFGHFREDAVTAEWREQFLAAMDYSWRRFQLLAGEEYGVRWLPTYVQAAGPPDLANPLHRYSPDSRALGAGEHPFPLDDVSTYNTMYVETGRFLQRLTNDIQAAGGRILVRRFASPSDFAALSEQTLFNCTGLGSRELFGDAGMIPVRGQLAILAPQPEVRYAFTGDAGYMFSRPDGIILGGTFERGEESAVVEPATIQRILARHAKLFGSLRCVA